uniref:Heme oxygenase n=1 Tax=Ahnfeltia plicata TaxID=28023 RepID=A0A1C9CAW8_9FLOR|nr:heme oxygenase [Ahnfeltia plicata]AOM65504.1 heme oxygenase [Ahnfeltia plicata]UAT97180.1 heme oxygenase [Ahnfeltia plicata]UAT97385.1 heme oxygenase [Ahnfeltia plicata]
MSTNLAQQLREGTTKSHSMAENVSFVKSFLGGVVDRKSYRKLVANLFFVYSAIEEEMEKNRENSSIQLIYFPELNRRESLIDDLKYYYGLDWLSKVQPSLATQIYVERIHNIGENQPELLISHAYTRYMGDLSGGQILKKIAQNAMQLSGTAGSSFYDFKDITDDNIFKKQYREALDNVPISDDQANQIIAEANIAFNLNMKMFQELDSNIIKIMVMLLFSTISNFRKGHK